MMSPTNCNLMLGSMPFTIDLLRLVLFEGLVLLLCGLCFLGLGAGGWYAYRCLFPNELSVINRVLTWGRLAPFSASAKDLTITTSGSVFTRSFSAFFTAPAADIEKWLRESPGTRECVPSVPAPGARLFKIAPGNGAMLAEVTVDDLQSQVSIHVYWS